MLHAFLKIVVSLGIRLYYRKIKIIHRDNLQENGATIIVANHPNTLMDAWMIGYACKQPVYFLAKATLFNSRFKMKLLRALKMIPINRAGEGAISGVSNASSFDKCYEILEEGKTLVIFPEGSSYLERQLRELKLGAARIALEVEKRGKIKVQIVPVGINYMRAEKFRSQVYLQVGKPIQVKSFSLETNETMAQSARKLTEQMRIALEHLLVNMDNKEEERLVEKITRLISSKYQGEKESQVSLNSLKKVRDRLDEIKLYEGYHLEEIESLVTQIEIGMKKLKLLPDFLDRRYRGLMFFRQLIFSLVFLFLALPLFCFGIIHNYLPFLLTDKIIPKITKEIEYYAPLAVLLGLVLYPFWYAACVFTVSKFIHPDWPLVPYFILMPVSGIFAFFFVGYFKHIGYKWSFVFASRNNDKELKELQEMRKKLKFIFE